MNFAPMVIVIIFFIILFFMFYCFTKKNKAATMTPGRSNRNDLTNCEGVTVTQITSAGPERFRIPLRSSQENVVDEDGFVLLPEPGDINITQATESTAAAVAASPVVVPPYPVDARHPTPQTNSGMVFGGSNPPYPTHTPHPIPTAGITPYPPTSAPTPYPPTSPPVSSSAPYPDYSGSPPSYSEAVAHAPVQPPKLDQEAFGKQAPYNPNY